LLSVAILALLFTPFAYGSVIYLNQGSMNAGNVGACDEFQFVASQGYAGGNVCGSAGGLQIKTIAGVAGPSYHTNAYLITTAPPGVTINWARTPCGGMSVNDAGQYIAGDFWRDNSTPAGTYGGGRWNNGVQCINTQAVAPNGINSSFYAFQLVCEVQPTCGAVAYVDVAGIQLQATETRPPDIVPQGGLWDQQSRYVRGSWPLSVNAWDPTGVCNLYANVSHGVATSQLQGPSSSLDQTHWQQCPEPSWTPSSPLPASPAIVDTTLAYPGSAGALTVTLNASNAAGVATDPNQYTRTFQVDNGVPTLSMSGPQDALSTAGTQYVSASASAGPSGVSRIECSVDGAPARSYPGASASVPLSGVGEHSVSCTAFNSAVDPSAAEAASPTRSWSMTIRQPTALDVTFVSHTRVRCRRARERVSAKLRWVTRVKWVRAYKPGRWVTVIHKRHVRRHGRLVTVRKRVRVHTPGRWVVERKVVKVRVRTRGRTKVVNRCSVPRLLRHETRRVPFGRSTTVSGWLGQTNGIAIAGQTVRILTAPISPRAPANPLAPFTPAATAVTNAFGSWSAKLPAGPSRLVELAFDGTSTLEPITSAAVRVVVPAKIKLTHVTRHVSCGQTLVIRGRVKGGYTPGGQILQFWSGLPHYFRLQSNPEMDADGRFTIRVRVASLCSPATALVAVSTVDARNFPYLPGTSRRVWVTVG
jgi:hypothetical protein